jgi:hypothetical protein
MKDSATLLRYHDDDRVLRDIEGLSQHARISQGFIRLCLSTGCPIENGRLSLAILLEWLFEHYPSVRALAGLPELPHTDGVQGGNLLKLKLGYAMVTLLEYAESRSTRLSEKEHLAGTRRCIERTLG